MTLRVGVVGAGYLGARHAEKLLAVPGARLIGVYDQDLERGANVACRVGCTGFGTLEALIDASEAVVVAAPARHHFEIASLALEAGRAVFVEKPIATHPDEAAQLLALAEERRVVLQVGHVERFNPAFIALQELVVAPRFIEVHRLSPYVQRGIETDVVLEIMIHDLDLVSALVGRPVVSVEAVGVPVLSSRNDIANARLTFAGGAVANLTSSRVSFQRMRKLRLFQEGEYLSADLETGEIARVIRQNRADGTFLEAVPISVCSSDALTRELEEFVNAVATSSRPRADGAVGLAALELAWRVLGAMRASSEPH